MSTLVAGGELERVTPDAALAARLLADGTRHIESARSAERLSDLTGAYQLAYDALRKAAAALLAVQGLRATSRGGTRHCAGSARDTASGDALVMSELWHFEQPSSGRLSRPRRGSSPGLAGAPELAVRW